MRSLGRWLGLLLTGGLLALPAPASHNPDEGHFIPDGPVMAAWEARWPGEEEAAQPHLALSPDGETLFVAGAVTAPAGDDDYLVLASDARTGAGLWTFSFSGPGGGDDHPAGIVVSPDGGRVFVTGAARWDSAAEIDADFTTIALNAEMGAFIWVRRYNGPGDGFDGATAMAMSPVGHAVVVTGASQNAGPIVGSSGWDYATVAYDPTTGNELWASRYNGPGNSTDAPTAVGFNANGGRVFVTGGSTGSASGRDYATVGYDGDDGQELWVARLGTAQDDVARALTVSPDGSLVFVTGFMTGATTATDISTLCYNATTGAEVWEAPFITAGPDAGLAVAVNTAGTRVFVTGSSFGGAVASDDIRTFGLNAATGAEIWTASFNGPENAGDAGARIAVTPAGDTVFVAGQTLGTNTAFDATVLAYGADTGDLVWTMRYDGPISAGDRMSGLAVSASGRLVYATGDSLSSGPLPGNVTFALCAVLTFTDVACTHFAWAFIEAVAAAGIAAGFPDGTYRPNNTVNRGQMAVFMARTADIPLGDFAAFAPPACGSESFSDVACGHALYKFIEYVNAKGIASGFPDGTYKPGNAVTRGAMAVFLSRVRNLFDGDFAAFAPPVCGSETFPDADCKHASYKFIEYIVSKGIASGFLDGTYRPNTVVTRAQMAVFVTRTASLPL